MSNISGQTTKKFATSHPPGSTIYESSSTDSQIKTVSSKNGSDFFITIINTDTETRNITLNTDGLFTKLTNQETGENFRSTTGVFELGVLDSFGILYMGLDSSSVGGLVSRLKLDENQGTDAFDVSGNSNDGTINGATWNDDNIDVTLTQDTDYSIDLIPATWTLLNQSFDRTGINSTYDFISRPNLLTSSANNISQGVSSFFGNSVTWFSLLAIVVILLIIGIIILSVKRFEASPFTQENGGDGL